MDSRRSGSEDRSSPALWEVSDLGEFEGILRSHDHVLVDFYADWCGPCRLMETTVEEVAQAGDATVLTVDVESLPELALRYDVHGLPSFLVFHHGTVTDRFVGMQEKETLLGAL